MWTAKQSFAVNASMVRELLSKLQSTRGGVKDTALNELTVSPTGVPSACVVVTIVTPVANSDKAARSASALAEGVFSSIG